LKLYRLAKKRGCRFEQVVSFSNLVDKDNALGLSYFEKRCKWAYKYYTGLGYTNRKIRIIYTH
jgi:hypothetical protein